jgi:hypothetical protein
MLEKHESSGANRNTKTELKGVSMSKHDIELINMKEKSCSTHEYDIRIDGVAMACKSVAVTPHTATDLTFRVTFSKDVKSHPDYREIRKQLLGILVKVHGMDVSSC